MKNSRICTLDNLKRGQEATVIEVNIKEARIKRRLYEMGLTEGTKVKIKKYAPFGDPICIELLGYDLCVSKNVLENIVVIKGNNMAQSQKNKFKFNGNIKSNVMPNSNVVLVGNPNCGKTTLFNLLTGMNQKIGNWPGVTIEKKEGIIKSTNIKIIDLPGLYSLNPYTEEEKISSQYILDGKAGIIVNVIDATRLERSLYLTKQLLEMNCNVIIALNMMDVLKKKGIYIDTKSLEQKLGTKVIEISARKETGIDDLINELKEKIKLRYWQRPKVQPTSNEIKVDIKRKKDKINLPIFDWLGIPAFILIMFTIYFLSVGVVGKYTTNVLNNFIANISTLISKLLNSIGIPEWIKSLLLDGILNGVGSVISFVPQLSVLFLCIALLEASGYLSRVAFLLDSLFRKIGLSGKTLIPFILGSGCSVPGIMSTKIIENEDERKIASILVPFIPCSAKLPIIALFSGYFFKENAGIASGTVYFLSIIIIILSSMLFKKYIFSNTTSCFILELPDYRLPNLKYILKEVYYKVLSFIKRAGSTILLASVLIWGLLSFSINLEYGVDIDDSILAFIGKRISWIFYPMLGVDSWEVAVSSIQGLIAKEQVISSMAIISGFHGNDMFFENSVFSFFNMASAYAFMIFNIFSAPCFAAIGSMKQSLGRKKTLIFAVIYQTVIAWCLATLIFTIFSFII